MKREKSVKNFIFGILNFVIITLLGIIIPRLFLLSYGSEVNGLISSVKQIFSYFSLLEAGVGEATLQALYGPVAKNDHDEVCSILSATNHFYRRTGIIYALLVIAMAIIYPFATQSDVPQYIIICIILFQGWGGVVKYLVTAKLTLLLRVDGKTYVTTNFGTIFTIFSDFARIALMSLGANVLMVQLVFCIVDLCQIFLVIFYTKKHYKWLHFKAKPNYDAISQRNSALVHQVSGLVFNNTDVILLTFFCGLKTVSVYSMYAMLFGMVSTIISNFGGSVSFAMGQLFNSDRKRFEELQETYETYYLSISFALFTIAYIFILPFLRLYTSGINDVNYVDKWIPMLFVAYQILNYGRNTSLNIVNFAGHYKQTQWRAILEAVINLVVSLVCVYKFGIYGVLIGTVAALLYRTNDFILYANHKVMNRSAKPTYRRWIRNIVLLLLCSIAGSFLPKEYSGYFQLIACAAVVGVAVLGFFLLVNSLIEKNARKTMIEFIKSSIAMRKNNQNK